MRADRSHSRKGLRGLCTCLVSAVVLSGCRFPEPDAQRSDEGSGSKLSIAASVYPLSYLVSRAAGPRARVVDLTRPGAEPHDAELSAGQVRTISDADLVVYLGGQFQPVVERAVLGLGERALDALPSGQTGEGDEDHEGSHVHEGGDEAGEAHADPHVWLDPVRMRHMNHHIALRLVQMDPVNGRGYLTRAASTDLVLAELDRDLAEGLRHCRHRQLMTGHGAFGYLAERYGLNQVRIGSGFAESEPTPGKLARLTLQARAQGVRTIFHERSTSAAAAKTLAREIGARAVPIDSIESAPRQGDYVSSMRRNLTALRRGLDCR